MKIEQTFIIGQHHYSFRTGEQALITGIKTIQPPDKEARVCYEILFDGGVIDFVPVSEVENGNFVFCTKVQAGCVFLPGCKLKIRRGGCIKKCEAFSPPPNKKLNHKQAHSDDCTDDCNKCEFAGGCKYFGKNTPEG